MSREEIETHTALRGLAAFLVMIYHYRTDLLPQIDLDSITLFFHSSTYLVDLFFILSGFVISYCYADSFKTQMQRPRLWRYFVNRFARLYPLHFLTTLLMVGLVFWRGEEDALERDAAVIAQNFLLIHAWGLQDQFVLNFPSWSISGEFLAYLLFPLLVVMLRWPFGLIPLVGIAVLPLAVFSYFHETGVVAEERIFVLRAVSGFAMGMVLYQVRDITKAIPDGVLSILQIGLFMTSVIGMHFGATLAYLFGPFACLVLLTWEDRGLLCRALARRSLLYVGALSYSVYMLHVPVRAMGYVVWGKFSGALPGNLEKPLFVLACILATLMLAALSYRLFESKARTAIRARLS